MRTLEGPFPQSWRVRRYPSHSWLLLVTRPGKSLAACSGSCAKSSATETVCECGKIELVPRRRTSFYTQTWALTVLGLLSEGGRVLIFLDSSLWFLWESEWQHSIFTSSWVTEPLLMLMVLGHQPCSQKILISLICCPAIPGRGVCFWFEYFKNKLIIFR